MLLLAHSRLRLSDRAQAKIRSTLEERGETNAAVRLFAEKTSDGTIDLGLAFDRRRDDDLPTPRLRQGLADRLRLTGFVGSRRSEAKADVVVPAEGVTVLADAQTLAIARDRVIDYETQGFTFAKDSACEARLFTE